MYQYVEITKRADRHASPGRSFAESFGLTVKSGNLTDMLVEVAAAMEEPLFKDLGPGTYTILIGDPYT